MADKRNRLGETLKLLERAKEIFTLFNATAN